MFLRADVGELEVDLVEDSLHDGQDHLSQGVLRLVSLSISLYLGLLAAYSCVWALADDVRLERDQPSRPEGAFAQPAVGSDVLGEGLESERLPLPYGVHDGE